jgi:hypothetical protein
VDRRAGTPNSADLFAVLDARRGLAAGEGEPGVAEDEEEEVHRRTREILDVFGAGGEYVLGIGGANPLLDTGISLCYTLPTG